MLELLSNCFTMVVFRILYQKYFIQDQIESIGLATHILLHRFYRRKEQGSAYLWQDSRNNYFFKEILINCLNGSSSFQNILPNSTISKPYTLNGLIWFVELAKLFHLILHDLMFYSQKHGLSLYQH